MVFRQTKGDFYTPEQVERALQSSGIDIVNEVDSDYIIFCPYHNNHRTPAGEVSKDSGMFFCFGCQESKTLVELIMFITRKSYFETLRIIESGKTQNNIENEISKMLEPKEEFAPYDEVQIRRLHSQAMESPRAVRYFEKRGITQESMKRFALGYSEKQDMVTVPVSTPDGKMFVGFVARSVEGKDFKNTPKLPKSKILLGHHLALPYSTVYVVESSFDAIRLSQLGVAAVSTLGANVSRRQTELLQKSFNNVIVIGDNDDAGRTMQRKVQERLGSKATIINLPSRFKDIGDMSDKEIVELVRRIDDPTMALL